MTSQPAAAPRAEALARADALSYAPHLRPGDRFSHTTAARLWSVDLPPGHDAIHVTATPPRNPPRARGITGHVDERPPVQRHGLPVSSPARTFVECARLLPRSELVAVGDSLVHDPEVLDPYDPRPLLTLSELVDYVRNESGAGSRAARQAVKHVRSGSASRPESLLRMLIVDAGLPEPELQVEVRDARGRFIGRVDIAYPAWLIAIEYDGQHHRLSDTQYERDATRVERLHAEGWTLIRVRKRGLFVEPHTTLRTIRAAVDAYQGR